MPIKIGLLAMVLSLYCAIIHAAEAEPLPMDLMELLGELDDDQDSLDQETLDAAMNSKNTKHEVNRWQQNTEAGATK